MLQWLLMEVMSKRLVDTERAAKSFVAALSRETHATVVGLSGELGSGKTAFAKGVAKALGVLQTVTSPTFVIEKIYKLEGQQFSHLIHIDAYRLSDSNELVTLGFNEVLRDPNNLVLIEWPERVSDVLPTGARIIHFTFVDDGTRTIKFP